MKRSIVYAGMFSVMVSVSAMTNGAVAAGTGNISDAVTTSVVPAINWVEMPEISPEVSSAMDLSSTASTPTPTTTTSGSGSTTQSGEGAAPEKSADEIRQDSERMRGQTEQSQLAPEKSPDDMDMKSERIRKVGSPRF